MADRRSRRSSSQSPSPLSSVLPSLAHLNLSAKLREYKIIKAWENCVGPALSKKAFPERLMSTILYCNAASSAWMSEINYQKATIIERINRELGYKAVTEIILKIGPVKAPFKGKTSPARPMKDLTPEEAAFIDSVTDGIKDDKLKTLIKRVIGKSKG